MKTKSLTKITLLSIFFMTLIAAITLNSCQKEVVKPKVLSSKALKVTSTASASSTLLLNEINNMLFSGSSSKKGKAAGKTEKDIIQNFNIGDTTGGVIVTVDTINKPDSIIFNYGAGCVGSDGYTRSGIAIVTYDAQDIRLVNNVYTFTFQNYSIIAPISTGGSNAPNSINSGGTTVNSSGGNTVANSNPAPAANINGSISITNTGPNTNGNLVIAQTGTYTNTTSSATCTVNVNYNCEWIAGESSSPLSNLQFSITGLVNSSSTDGTLDSIVITTPLIKNSKTPGCNYYISGNAYTNSNVALYPTYLNYSNPGGCSGQVAETVNGVTNILNQ
jgi:hypothetical protein